MARKLDRLRAGFFVDRGHIFFVERSGRDDADIPIRRPSPAPPVPDRTRRNNSALSFLYSQSGTLDRICYFGLFGMASILVVVINGPS